MSTVRQRKISSRIVSIVSDEFADAITKHCGIDSALVTPVLESISDVIIDHLLNNVRVKIPNLGTFGFQYSPESFRGISATTKAPMHSCVKLKPEFKFYRQASDWISEEVERNGLLNSVQTILGVVRNGSK